MAKLLSLHPCKTPKEISRGIPFKLISHHSLWLLSLNFREEIGMGQVGQVHELLKYFGERTGTVKSPHFDRAFTNNNFYSITLAGTPLEKKSTDRVKSRSS